MLELKRPYDHRRWRKRAKAQLRLEPLCWMCLAKGIVTAATVADHVEPHRGDEYKFWCGALKSLCASHHSRSKQQIEKLGYTKDVGADGIRS